MKFKTKLLVVLSVLILFVAINGNSYAANKTIVVTANELRVRTIPWGNITGYVNSGDKYTIYASKKDSSGNLWHKIKYKGRYGYIYAAYTKQVSSSTKAKSKKSTQTTIYNGKSVKINTKWLRVRTAPWGNILGGVAYGEQYKIYASQRDSSGNLWYKIKYKGRYGYIYASYTKQVSASTKAKSTKAKSKKSTQTTTQKGKSARINTKWLRVRTSPWGKILGEVGYGEQYKIYASQKDSSGNVWYKIKYKGRYGYIYAAYTKQVSTSTKTKNTKAKSKKSTQTTTQKEKSAKINTEWLRVRTSPWGKILGEVRYGEQYKIYASQKDSSGDVWYKIKYKGRYGYIYAAYTKQVSASTKAKNTKAKSKKSNQTTTQNGKSARINTKWLRVRTSPWGKILGEVGYGEQYKIYASQKDSSGDVWYKIKYKGRYGYIYAAYTKVGTYIPINKLNNVMIISDRATVFDGTNGSVLGNLKKGTKVEYIKKIKDKKGEHWYQIIYNDKVGYVKALSNKAILVEKPKTSNPKVYSGNLSVKMIPNQTQYVYGQTLRLRFDVKSIKDPVYYIQGLEKNRWKTYNVYDPDKYRNAPILTLYSPKIRILAVSKKNKSQKVSRIMNFKLIKKSIKLKGIKSAVYGKKAIRFTVEPNNIKHPLYQVHISDEQGKTAYFRDYSSKPKYSWVPKKYGSYLVTVIAKDNGGDNGSQIIKSKNIVVSKTKSPAFYMNTNKRYYMNAPIKFKIVSSKQFKHFKWSYKLNGGKEKVIRGFSSKKTLSYRPKKEGSYEFILTSKNKNGKQATFKKRVIAKKLSSEIPFKKSWTPNYYESTYGFIPDKIVAHITEGSYSSSVSWLSQKRSEVSSNFVISRKGEVTQLLDIGQGPWTNGTNLTSGGNVYYYDSRDRDVVDRKANANFYTVTIEHEGIHSQTEGKLTAAQKEATIKVVKYIRSEVKRIYNKMFVFNKSNFIGHSDVNPVSKGLCPGRRYPFYDIIKKVNK